MVDPLERKIYAAICSHDGVKAREIARLASCTHTEVNHWLYASPFMRDLCYRDDDYLWHGLIRQGKRHYGLEDFSGYYGTVGEFLSLSVGISAVRRYHGERNSEDFFDIEIKQAAVFCRLQYSASRENVLHFPRRIARDGSISGDIPSPETPWEKS